MSKWRVQRTVERRGLRGVRADGRIGRLLVDDVVLRPPAAHVVREDDVRRELVAERDPLLREGRCERDVVRLLEIAPQIGLDVHDHGLRALHPREQQPHVVPVRRHRRCVAQVGEIGVRLVCRRPASTAAACSTSARGSLRAATSRRRTSTRTSRSGSTSTSPAPCSRRRRDTGSESRTRLPCAARRRRRAGRLSPSCSVCGQPAGRGGSGSGDRRPRRRRPRRRERRARRLTKTEHERLSHRTRGPGMR